MPSKERKGMCARCLLSEMKEMPGVKDRKYRFCRRYMAFCQPVARNCPGPVERK